MTAAMLEANLPPFLTKPVTMELKDYVQELETFQIMRYQLAFYSDLMDHINRIHDLHTRLIYAKLEPWGA